MSATPMHEALVRQAVEETRRLIRRALEAALRGDREGAAQAIREAAERASALAAMPGGEAAARHVRRVLGRAAAEIGAGRAGHAAGLLRTALHGLQHGLLSAAARKQQQDSMALSR